MEFLGIGPLELISILLIIFVVMGPGDMVKMGSTLGKTLRNIRQSEVWAAMQRASKELRTLPDTLAKQVDLDDLKEMKNELQQDIKDSAEDLKGIDREFVAWSRKNQDSEDNSKSKKETKTKNSKTDKSKDS
jgi:Sec-independent protein translocase protein TatA